MIKSALFVLVILCGGAVSCLWQVFRETYFKLFACPVIDQACCRVFLVGIKLVGVKGVFVERLIFLGMFEFLNSRVFRSEFPVSACMLLFLCPNLNEG